MPQKMTYHERLDMEAHALFSLINNYTDAYVSKHDPLIQSKARDDIAAQAEAIRNMLPKIFKHPNISYYVEQSLLEHGYIDPKTEEDENRN